MTSTRSATALLALSMFAAQPTVAAAQITDGTSSASRASAFAGLNVRLPLGSAAQTKPTARLQLTTAYTVQDSRTGFTKTFKARGIELGAGLAGKPAMFIGGHEVNPKTAKKLNMGGTGTNVAVVVGGVVVIGVILLLAAGYELDI